jgi:NhaP-type Na+/H+ or K+/H+ antiporter
MMISILLLFILSLILGTTLNRFGLPKIVGFIGSGILLGPFVFDVLSHDVMMYAAELRYAALVIIILRAGFSLDLETIKKHKKIILLLSFVPAIIEILAAILFAHLFLGFTFQEALLLGSVIAAVSPAIIVPKMIQLIESKTHDASLPKVILMSASLDDIFVVIIFSIVIQTFSQGTFSSGYLFQFPLAILMGFISGLVVGHLLSKLFRIIQKFRWLKTVSIVLIGFIFMYIEINQWIPFSGLIGIMVIGMYLLKTIPNDVDITQKQLKMIWFFAEIILFSLIGAALDINNAVSLLWIGILLIVFMVTFRLIGVRMIGMYHKFSKKEIHLITVSYIPKATVQASIAAIPLSLGITEGNTILSVAVISILLTAPLGAFLIDQWALTYKPSSNH